MKKNLIRIYRSRCNPPRSCDAKFFNKCEFPECFEELNGQQTGNMYVAFQIMNKTETRFARTQINILSIKYFIYLGQNVKTFFKNYFFQFSAGNMVLFQSCLFCIFTNLFNYNNVLFEFNRPHKKLSLKMFCLLERYTSETTKTDN